MIAAAVALDVLLAMRALLALRLDGFESRLLIRLELLDSHLVLGARLSLVEWSIAWHTGFGAAMVAGADVFFGANLLFALLCFASRGRLSVRSLLEE